MLEENSGFGVDTDKSLSDILGGGGDVSPFFTGESVPGDEVSGKIRSVKVFQPFVYGTQTPATFQKSGKPKFKAVFEIENENGVFSVFVNLWGLQRDALTAAKNRFGRFPVEGDFMRARFAEYVPQKNGLNPAKRYEYEFSIGSASGNALEAEKTPEIGAAGVSDSRKQKIIKLSKLDWSLAEIADMTHSTEEQVREVLAEDSQPESAPEF